ncbi:MAG: hypothetical protein ACFB0Z_14525 [Candidatus Phaeomarinobacter sp.]
MRLFFLWVGLLILGVVALMVLVFPTHGHTQDLDSAARYRDCLRLVTADPDQAFDQAMEWRSNGGGAAARHCEALALVELKLYGDAAVRLGDLADAPDAGESEDRAALLAQAGNAWLLAGSGENAAIALTAALELTPGDSGFLMDRARAHAAAQDYAAAEQDLSQALALKPDEVDALVLRAGARRAQDNVTGASEDISRAVALRPDGPFVLVERGAIRLAQGDDAGARADWVAVARIVGGVEPDHPDAPALLDAQRSLEALDVDK